MALSRSIFAIAALFLFLVSAASSFAGEFNDKLEIGDTGPGWQNVLGTDNKLHALADYKGKKLIVNVFTSNACPISRAYESRLIQLQKEYSDRGVQIIAINVDANANHQIKQVKNRSSSKPFNFPYLFDKSKRSARAYGATVTPQVFVLDENRRVVYMGAIDDTDRERKVSKRYLRTALESLLGGKELSLAETEQFGSKVEFNQ